MTKRQKERNDRFNALPASKQRVEIAKDVLKWLAIGKLKPKTGGYLKVPDKICDKIENETTGQFQDILKSPGFSCTVCAKGAIFACAVNRKDNVTNDKALFGWQGSTISNKLDGVFEADQFELIETAFEGYSPFHSVMDDEVFEFYSKHNTPRKRMVAIMKNIIANDGTFIP